MIISCSSTESEFTKMAEKELKGGYVVRGTVKWFDNEKGYGFIEVPNMADIFVHYSVIQCEGYKTLSEGQVVDFTLIHTEKGYQAVEVSAVEPEVVATN